MQTNELQTFSHLLKQVGALYGKAVNEVVIDLYWQALQCFDLAQIRQALQTHITNPDAGQYMPKPANVICILQGSSQTQALQAWSLVASTIGRLGGYTTVVFDDALIHAVITDMGGWVHLCKTSQDELPFKANEFEKRYAGYVLHPPVGYPKKLIGSIDHQNQLQGYKYDAPTLVGDAEKARLVYEDGSENVLSYRKLDDAPKSLEATFGNMLPTLSVQTLGPRSA